MEWFIIFGIFFAILCGILANNKNRNVVGWAIGGALTGIFATIILAVLPKLDKED